MRRPIPIATVVILFLLVLGIPFLRLQIGLPDDRVLSPSHSSRQVQDLIRSDFTSNEAGALQVIAPGSPIRRLDRPRSRATPSRSRACGAWRGSTP